MMIFFLRVSIILFSCINYSYAKDNNFTDYPLSFIVESCLITKQRSFPESIEQEQFYENKKKYYTCMNFIMSLSTTLNRRCISSKKKEISPENAMTFADLSNVNSTSDLINEIIEYSNKYPHFLNQIGWLHASKAISQKWPCK
ncbi:MAG: hypothetical protein CBC53_007265 [Alphaproteobacteria bacterium TMED93]|nr:MAG: hypothetical protein CBC53_007265 [Alphaproteobacteria bacterium TMED93]